MSKRGFRLIACLLLTTFVGTAAAVLAAPRVSGTVRIVFQGATENDTIDPVSGVTLPGKGTLEAALKKRFPDLNIEVIPCPAANWVTKVETLIKAGQADVGFLTNQVGAPDLFMDLTPYLSKDKEVNLKNLNDIFLDGIVHYIKYRSFDKPQETNKIFGLPFTNSANQIYYDKQLFDDWGTEYLGDNSTYAEILAKAKKMTGKNPKTGKQNYGIFFKSYWLEWHSVGFNAIRPAKIDGMLINNLDLKNNVEYIKDSKEVLDFFSFIIEALNYAPPGIATGEGSEKWLTDENDVAINLDLSTTVNYLRMADVNKDLPKRFVPINIPLSKDKMADFPGPFQFTIAKNTKNPDAAWEVIKALTTDKKILDLCLILQGRTAVLKNIVGLKSMKSPVRRKVYDFQAKYLFMTDDYWYWRQPLTKVLSSVLAKKLTAEQARDEFYKGVVSFVDSKKKQMGS